MGKLSAAKQLARRPPEVKAARTRLYAVVNKETKRVKNKEGYTFDADEEDLVYIGEYSKTEELTPTDLTLLIGRLRGFFFIRFVKANGDVRDMYAHVDGPMVGSVVPLRDLEKPASTQRSCHVDKVLCVIARDTMYVVKSAMLGKRVKRKPRSA